MNKIIFKEGHATFFYMCPSHAIYNFSWMFPYLLVCHFSHIKPSNLFEVKLISLTLSFSVGILIGKTQV